MKFYTLVVCSTLIAVAAPLLGGGECEAAEAARRPNVILIMTDDQGYGDVGAHGNTMIQTPHLDRLAAESTRLTNFHVDPTCAPTRAALMTGRFSVRTGVWHTIMGRSLLRRDEHTLANAFADNDYTTGIFGKWHLGDNYPYRPHDRGFDEVFIHGGGGVGQTPDYFGNDYFDDTYFHNGQPEQVEGYCTDVWFDRALDFIAESREQPFFCYLATNAPHSPYRVDAKYSQPYVDQGVPRNMANFYGMITNFDENLGRLLARLDELQLAENTILIFMTDNGTAAGVDPNRSAGAGWRGFDARMRGKKGSAYDGGHRVPFYIRWPAEFETTREIDQLAAHIDVLPTLAELCGFQEMPEVALDGTSLAPLLHGDADDWPERTLVVDSQRIEHPEKWRQSAVMAQRWRLVNGGQLFDIQADPAQKRDVAAEHSVVVAELRSEYEAWWRSVSKRFDEMCPIVLGHEAENPTLLTGHDWHTPIKQGPWHQGLVRNEEFFGNGPWSVEVSQPGRYAITLYKQPPYMDHPLEAAAARLKIADIDDRQKPKRDAASVRFEVTLPEGETQLQTWLTDAATGKTRGAYYVEVERLGPA